jgi:hydroxymethylglutaryl-CoA reductase
MEDQMLQRTNSTESLEHAVAAELEPQRSSRIPGFYKMSVRERHEALVERGFLTAADVAPLESAGALGLERADQMIENMIGVLGMPLGVGLNFTINGRDYVVPMAIEEPSVLAAVSHVAKIARASGGFTAGCDSDLMIGQIQVVGVTDVEAARAAVLEARAELLAMANALHPKMQERGGGAKDIEVRVVDEGGYSRMVVVHLLIDCRDAMGANLINTMAEGIAPRVEELTGGKVFLRILSNLADRRLAYARCEIPLEDLAWKGYTGREVAEGIQLASEFAEADPYRATTHNKGVMNGISAVCIATGNDWRAIEAGAHAHCARDGRYRPMATWRVAGDRLVGEIEVALQVGIVGGPIRLHPTVQIAHRILDVDSARELAGVMAAVGLAQNMAAVKALATVGIQKGHMSLHARSVAATAGAGPDEVEEVVARMIDEDDVKVHRAEALLREIRAR